MNKMLAMIIRMVYSLSALFTALLLAWLLLSKVDFFYPVLYNQLEINKTIAQYAPLNRYKKGFEHTRAEQHQRIFSEILTQVNEGGEGLAQLTYRVNQHDQRLLTSAEVTHLQDVAKLVYILMISGMVAFLLWCSLSAYYLYSKKPLPRLKSQLVSLLTVIAVMGAGVLVVGSVKVFYWLHRAIFPENHQWFFYYEDSLMSTLMKAPDLFGPISVMLVVLAIVLFITLGWVVQWGYKIRVT